MDTKWRNNKIVRTAVVVIVVLVIAAGNLYFFPHMIQQAKILRQEEQRKEKSEDQLDTDILEKLYYGTHVLYKEAILAENRGVEENAVSVVAGAGAQETHVELQQDYYTDEYTEFFYYGNEIDYCVLRPNVSGEFVMDLWNGTSDLADKFVALEDAEDGSKIEKELQKQYEFYAILAFDQEGKMTIPKIYDRNFSEENVERELQHAERNAWREFGQNEYKAFPKDIKIVFAMDEDSYVLDVGNSWDGAAAYFSLNVVILPICSLTAIILFALLLRNPKPREGKKESLLMRYPLIPLVFGVYLCGMFLVAFPYWIDGYERMLEGLKGYQNDSYLLGYILSSQELKIMANLGYLLLFFGMYAIVYYTIALIRPIFKMGIISYLKEKSLILCGIDKVKYYIKKWKEELENSHIEEDKKKKIITILFANFVILSILSVFWFFAIPMLLIYTILLYFYVQKIYVKVKKDYQTMAQATEEIASGHLEYEMKESMGIYEPMRDKLGQVQDGMKKAVMKEVKSQRMKTELISNVSHDLKTPLTAITTYVELLKNPNISEEERKDYVETLERKSLRLKTLIEDLFEVSKTSSHDIVLNKEEVDMVHLLKQAGVEQQEKWGKMGLTIRYQVPTEKVILSLDGQKTYRIFDNLFGNITKYALPNTRVYVEVLKADAAVTVVIRNISAVELSVTSEEITERFVRGDESRNTEGSGLGLAIAKNLVEVQGGTMQVALDGDLFKVIITW